MLRKMTASLTGLLLLPCAAGLALAIYQALVSLYMLPAGAKILNLFTAGAGCWLILFIIFPRPVRSYILAHELSHLLVAWLSGVKGGTLRVGADGGSVEVEKSTLWIALAPYMIPFYSLLLIAAHFVASLWWDPALWVGGLPFGLGLTWSFHLCFTLYILMIPQSDVQPYGRMGAYSLILSINLLLLCTALFTINREPLHRDIQNLWTYQQSAYHHGTEILRDFFNLIKNAIIQS